MANVLENFILDRRKKIQDAEEFIRKTRSELRSQITTALRGDSQFSNAYFEIPGNFCAESPVKICLYPPGSLVATNKVPCEICGRTIFD